MDDNVTKKDYNIKHLTQINVSLKMMILDIISFEFGRRSGSNNSVFRAIRTKPLDFILTSRVGENTIGVAKRAAFLTLDHRSATNAFVLTLRSALRLRIRIRRSNNRLIGRWFDDFIDRLTHINNNRFRFNSLGLLLLNRDGLLYDFRRPIDTIR